jgi:hypothetical protein
MEEVEFAKLEQYIIKVVNYPAVIWLPPSITICPPYHKTARIPIYGKN